MDYLDLLKDRAKKSKVYSSHQMTGLMLAEILKENPVTQIPPDILLIFRVLGLMSGLQKRLDSRVNMMDTIMPYAEEQASLHVAEAAGA